MFFTTVSGSGSSKIIKSGLFYGSDNTTFCRLPMLNNKTLFRIIRCLEADASKPPAERTFPVFVVVATKFRQLADTRPVLELCLSSEGTIAYNPLK
jgi:hypothetical protein